MSFKALKVGCELALVSAMSFFVATGSAATNDKVLGEVRFEADTQAAKTAGVWIDGQYVGYVHELKGSKKVLLLPGEHKISAREAGFTNFETNIQVMPNQVQVVRVTLTRDPRAELPKVTGEIKLTINPDRAAVFVDGTFAGHAHEFSGSRGMLLGPGKHHIKISLPGYETFDTDIDVKANQKYEVKTTLPSGPETGTGS
jgi:hypothetical protein